MIYIQQIKLPTDYSESQLLKKAAGLLGISQNDITSYEIVRRSVDARKKPEIFYVISLYISCRNEAQVVKRSRRKDVTYIQPKSYTFPASGSKPLAHRPVVVGSGPAGLFCAYELAKHGYEPLVLERGEDAVRRIKSVQRFWEGGTLNPESNVQFGEGGAGTFSDGKLNTLNKDPRGRNREVLKTFVQMGAKESILYDQKPHVGTDRLIGI
ncbi:MAG: NAD(P)-binding protein, partial [Lachnospiraceae bacterium]|nr:NAD(P)-binding protein [Lachnospiraceae bacterium]